MITNVGVRWGLTVLFLVCVGLYGRQAIGAPSSWQQRFGWWLHMPMAAAMIAMAWPAGMSIPTLLYILVFSAAALYFLYFAVFGAGVDHAFYHALMMAAMVAMAVVMPTDAMTGMSPATAMGAGHNVPMAGMGTVHSAATSAPPTWVSVACGLAAAGFVGAALWWLTMLIRGQQRLYATLLMSLGMGLTFAAMAI